MRAASASEFVSVQSTGFVCIISVVASVTQLHLVLVPQQDND